MALLLLIGAALAIVLLGAFAIIGTLLKLVFWLLLLPLRLAFGLVAGAVGIVAGIVALPLAMIGIALAAIVALAALLVPVLPLLVLAAIGWATHKSVSRHPSPIV